MPVSSDHAAVQTDVAHREGGHKLQLCAEKIAFHHAVFFVEQLQNIKLDELAALIAAEGAGADENIELLAAHAVRQRALHLLLRKVGQQIRHYKFGLLRLIADGNVYLCAVAAHDYAVQGERDRRPLVFFDAAVVMGLQQRHLKILIKRIGLKVKARGVDMRRGDTHALAYALFADDGKDDRLFPVQAVDLVARPVAFLRVKGHKAMSLCLPAEKAGGLALCARSI